MKIDEYEEFLTGIKKEPKEEEELLLDSGPILPLAGPLLFDNVTTNANYNLRFTFTTDSNTNNYNYGSIQSQIIYSDLFNYLRTFIPELLFDQHDIVLAAIKNETIHYLISKYDYREVNANVFVDGDDPEKIHVAVTADGTRFPHIEINFNRNF